MASSTRAVGNGCRGSALALVGGLLAAMALLPTRAHAQLSTGALQQGAVGFGLWYGAGNIRLDAAPSSADAETRGYSEALPSTFQEQGPALGISYGTWGLNVGFGAGEKSIGKNVDVTGDAAADKFVVTARRTFRTANLVYQPVRGLYAGYGREEGTMEFTQVDLATNQGEIRKIPYDYNFYTIGVAIGFDPQKRALGPILAAYAKLPEKRGAFTGTTLAFGFGIYF